MTQERHIEQRSVDYYRSVSARAVKVGYNGYPDRIVLHSGDRFYWVELKNERGNLRPAQRSRIRQLRASGETVYVCRSLQQIRTVHLYELRKKKMKAPSSTKVKGSNDELYTPPDLIEYVTQQLGGNIELDTCSCAAANSIVKADRYFDKNRSCLTPSASWLASTVYMNPIYSNPLPFVSRMVEEFSNHCFEKGVMLLKADCSTQWASLVYGRFPILFLRNRVKFYNANLKPTSGGSIASILVSLGFVFTDAEEWGYLYLTEHFRPVDALQR